MNYIFLFIVLFVIIVLIALILFFNKTVVQVIGSVGGYINTTTNCNVNVNTLPDLSFNQCCTIFGTATNTRYLSSLNLVVSPTPISYLDVCSGFCTAGYNKVTDTCASTTDGTNSGEANFQACVTATAPPAGCTNLSLPVAIANTLLLYPFSATNLLCPSTAVCGITG